MPLAAESMTRYNRAKEFEYCYIYRRRYQPAWIGAANVDSRAWLEAAGEHLLKRIRSEDPVFLIELEMRATEVSDLLKHLSRCRDLPWQTWAHACVAVAAVQ